MQLTIYPLKETEDVTRQAFEHDPETVDEMAENMLVINRGLKVYQEAKNLDTLAGMVAEQKANINRIFRFAHYGIYAQLLEKYLQTKGLELDDVTAAVVTERYVTFNASENWLLDNVLHDSTVHPFKDFCNENGFNLSLAIH